MLLAELRIGRTHSRPQVSNDNPFSEAAFKTFKYCPAFPGRFGYLADARSIADRFFKHYNHSHYHLGIGLYKPASVHFGTAEEYGWSGPRCSMPPTPPIASAPTTALLPGAVWINKPQEPEEPEDDAQKKS
jgi:putative transposase